MGLRGAPWGRRKQGRGAPKQAAEEQDQLQEKKSGRGAVYSWGTTKSGRQGSLEEHGLVTMGTQVFGAGWCWVRLGLGFRGDCGICGLAEVLSHGYQASSPCGAEEPIVTNLDEAFRQDVLQKAVNELFCRQGTTFFCAGLSGAVAKRDAVIFQLEEAVVANGNSENVRGQILQGMQASADRFTMHNPLLLPNICRNACITSGVTQRLLQFATENPGERSHRQQEIVPCPNPAFFSALPTTARDEIVDVRMVGQVASPGVQHTHHPNLAAKPTWLSCQLLCGSCGRFEQQIVKQSLVSASHLVEASR